MFAEFDNRIVEIPDHGGSFEAFKRIITRYVKTVFPVGASALDVGCGQGVYGMLLRGWFIMDGMDIYPPHNNELTQFLYRNMTTADIRNYEYDYYNLVVMGDVIEHLSVEDAQKVIAYAKDHCDMLVIAVPYNYVQEANENAAELHIQDDLTDELFHERYPGFYQFCAVPQYGYYIWKKE